MPVHMPIPTPAPTPTPTPTPAPTPTPPTRQGYVPTQHEYDEKTSWRGLLERDEWFLYDLDGERVRG